MWQMFNNWRDAIDSITGSGSVTYAIILAFGYFVFCGTMAVIFWQSHRDIVRIVNTKE